MKIESTEFTQSDLHDFLNHQLDRERMVMADRLENASARLAKIAPKIKAGPGADSWSDHEVLAHIAVLSKFYGVLVHRISSGQIDEVDLLSNTNLRDVAGEQMAQIEPAELLRAIQTDHARTIKLLRTVEATSRSQGGRRRHRQRRVPCALSADQPPRGAHRPARALAQLILGDKPRKAEPPQLLSNRDGGAIHHGRVRVGILIAEVQVVQPANRHDMEVHVRNLEPRQHQPDAHRLEAGHLRLADRLRGGREVGEQIRVNIEPMVDLLARHHQGMSGAERAVGEECHALVVLPHKPRGQLAGDDAGEDARHVSKTK